MHHRYNLVRPAWTKLSIQDSKSCLLYTLSQGKSQKVTTRGLAAAEHHNTTDHSQLAFSASASRTAKQQALVRRCEPGAAELLPDQSHQAVPVLSQCMVCLLGMHHGFHRRLHLIPTRSLLSSSSLTMMFKVMLHHESHLKCWKNHFEVAFVISKTGS